MEPKRAGRRTGHEDTEASERLRRKLAEMEARGRRRTPKAAPPVRWRRDIDG